MREIKFRVWDKEFKRMKVSGMGINKGVLDGDDIEIMQYTGLKDKNGRDIYEGDIFGGMWGDGWIGYCDKCKSFEYFSVGPGCMACDGDVHWYEMVEAESEGQLEVIGNIYENPYLLKP